MTLHQRIIEHDNYFCSLMDSIPRNLYFPIEHSEEACEKFFKVRKGEGSANPEDAVCSWSSKKQIVNLVVPLLLLLEQKREKGTGPQGEGT
jgi:hypothetical protein